MCVFICLNIKASGSHEIKHLKDREVKITAGHSCVSDTHEQGYDNIRPC